MEVLVGILLALMVVVPIALGYLMLTGVALTPLVYFFGELHTMLLGLNRKDNFNNEFKRESDTIHDRNRAA